MIERISLSAFIHRTITRTAVARLKNGKVKREIDSLKSFDSASQPAAWPARLFESFKFGSKNVPSMIKKINKRNKNPPRVINQLLNRLGLLFLSLCIFLLLFVITGKVDTMFYKTSVFSECGLFDDFIFAVNYLAKPFHK